MTGLLVVEFDPRESIVRVPERARKAAGHGLHELRRSPVGGACEFSLVAENPRAKVGYTEHQDSIVAERVKTSLSGSGTKGQT